MIDGTRLAGPHELRQALVARADLFVAALTERLLTYALGRELGAHDMPAVRGIVRAAAAEEHSFRALVQAIAASATFQRRIKTGLEVPAE
jgi:hypothetical protein